MSNILIPGGMRCVLQARDINDAELLNVFHVKADHNAIVYADCLAVANTIKSWWDISYRHMCNNEVTGTQVVVTGTDTIPAAQSSIGLTEKGDRPGAGLPTSVTLAIKGVTHIAGRRHRGRNFAFPAVFPDLEILNPDLFNSSYVNAITGVFNTLVQNISIAGYLLGVGSYADGAIYPYSSYIALDAAVDSQRRRLLGRGR